MMKRIVIMVVGVLITVMALALPACLSDSADESVTEGLGSNQPVEQSDEDPTLTPPANGW